MSKNPDHVPPDRIWSYLHMAGELTLPEHIHIANCEHCLQLFLQCAKSDTLASALDSFADDTDERRSA